VNISDEGIEAAARLLWARDGEDIHGADRPSWDAAAKAGRVWAAIREDTRQDARMILAAAAPHMRCGHAE
jgi:hypothetical protein